MSIKSDIINIYIGYYNRAPDVGGLDYWIGRANAGMSMSEIAASYAVQVESTTNYPYLKNPGVASVTDFINSVYQNLFNRAPDAGGLDYWKGQLEAANGKPDAVGAMILNIISGATTAPDSTVLANKGSVALDWVTKAAAVPNFTYDSSANVSAHAVISGVDATTGSVTAAQAATTSFMSNYVSSDATFTLTSGLDNFPGTSANNLFLANQATLSTDTINGAAGTDTLRVTDTTGTSFAPLLTSVEVIEISALHNSTSTFNLANSTGVTAIKSVNGQGNVVVNGAKAIHELEMTSTTGSAGVQVFYAAAAVAGSTDTQIIKLNSASFGGAIAIDNIETFEIALTGTNSGSNIIGSKNITVTGSGSLEATVFSSASGGFYDAAAATGVQKIVFNSPGDIMVRGGTKGDIFDLTNSGVVDVSTGDGEDNIMLGSTFTTADAIDGGSGKDTLVVTSFGGTTAAANKTTGIEVLEATSSSTGLTASDYTSINEFVFSGGPAGGRVNLTGVESDDRFVFASDQGTGDEAVRFTGATAGTKVTMELRADSGTNGEVTLTSNTNTGNDVSAVGFRTNIGSVVIDSTGTNTKANLVEAIDTGSYNFYAFDNSNGTASFTITGSHDLTIAAKAGVTLSASSDTFGFKSAVSVDASAFTGNLRIAGSASADSISGGSGADIIYGLSGADTLTGNGGADQFRFVGTNQTDKIKDFSVGTDKIGFNQVDFTNTTATSAGATLASDDYVQNRNSITNIGSADNHKVIELQDGFSTSQIQSDTGAAVEAYVLVFNTTTNKGEIWFDSNWSDSSSRTQVATLDNIVDLIGVKDFSATDFVEFTA